MIRRADQVSDAQAVEIALGMGAGMSPYSDLVSAIRQGVGCTANVAAKIANRIIEHGLIHQVTEVRNTSIGQSSMSVGYLSVPTAFTHWAPGPQEDTDGANG